MVLLREQVFVPENRRSRSLTKSRLSEIIHAVWDAFALAGEVVSGDRKVGAAFSSL
jgi:hypothetical protein